MDEKNTTAQKNDDMFLGETGKELRTRFELLPKELQDTITSSDYQMKLFEIAKKYKLTYDKLGQLELETTMVLLGMTPPEEYSADLSEQLGMKEVELSGLVKDVNDQVFLPIREQLKKVYTNTPGESTPAQSTPSQNTVVRAYDTPKQAEVPQAQMQKREADVFTNSGIEIVGQTPPVGGGQVIGDRVKGIVDTSINRIPTAPVSLGDIKDKAQAINNTQPNPLPFNLSPNTSSSGLPLNIPIPTPPKPVQSSAPGIVAEGLGGVVANPNTTKDYSVPNMTSAPKGGDPYREQI